MGVVKMPAKISPQTLRQQVVENVADRIAVVAERGDNDVEARLEAADRIVSAVVALLIYDVREAAIEVGEASHKLLAAIQRAQGVQ